MIESEGLLSTGMSGLDALIGGLIPGDNIVWASDCYDVLSSIERAYVRESLPNGRACIYVLASGPDSNHRSEAPGPGTGATVVDARPGHVACHPAALERALVGAAQAAPVCCVVDSLDALASRWGTEQVLNFFRRVSTRLFALNAVTYWRILSPPANPALLDGIRQTSQGVIRVRRGQLQVVKADGRHTSVQGQVADVKLVNLDSLEVRSRPQLSRLAEGLKGVRTWRGLTKSELARMVGVSASAISQAESGLIGLSLDTLVAISDCLDVCIDDLVRGPTPMYLVYRHIRGRDGGNGTPLERRPGGGLRVTPVDLAAGEASRPSESLRGGGAWLLIGGSGIVQMDLADDSPMARPGDVILGTAGAPVSAWRNLLPQPARFHWVQSVGASPGYSDRAWLDYWRVLFDRTAFRAADHRLPRPAVSLAGTRDRRKEGIRRDQHANAVALLDRDGGEPGRGFADSALTA